MVTWFDIYPSLIPFCFIMSCGWPLVAASIPYIVRNIAFHSLLICVWFVQVAEMISMLEDWPKLSPDRALELLDYAYAEPAVRSFAIECLTHIRLEFSFICSFIYFVFYSLYLKNHINNNVRQNLFRILMYNGFVC